MYMEYIQYGDLLRVQNKFKKLSHDMVMFYTANIIAGINYMHSKHIMHRDLKPENVLVANDGYLKISDLGFAKYLFHQDRTSTNCGTPEY